MRRIDNMFNRKYKKAIDVIEKEIEECYKMAKWAKSTDRSDSFDSYIAKVVVLKKVLSKIKGEES